MEGQKGERKMRTNEGRKEGGYRKIKMKEGRCEGSKEGR
jgi:hypothetical protein